MKTKIYKITFSVVFLFSLVTLKSQAQQVRILNTENSKIPHNQVTSIAIDAQGNKWFGTYYGEVVKFDDINWTVYNKSNSKLTGNLIESIAIDAQDNIWIGTNDFNGKSHGELLKFDNTNWTVYDNSNSGLPYAGITDIAIDALGNKWIGTHGGGVVKFDGTNWTSYLDSKFIYAINIDSHNNKWIATQSEIVKFDDTNWTLYKLSKSIIPYYNGNGGITSIAFDKKGNKWFGVGEDWDSGAAGGVTEFDDVNWTIFNSTNSGLPYGVHSSATDQMGNIWFATTYWSVGALVKYDGTNWTVYDNANSGFPIGAIEALVIDDQGNKWFATANSGVVEFNENGIAGFNKNGITTGLSSNISVSSADFTVYPNPTTKFLILSVENFNSENLSFQVIDIYGRVLNNQKIRDAQTRIPMENLTPAIYGLQVMTNGKVVNTFKIVKN